MLLRGRAVVRTPWRGEEVIIAPPAEFGVDGERDWEGSESGRVGRVERQMVLALDVLGKGHLTFYPGEAETVALQIPLGSGMGGLKWEVVGEGPC